MPQPDTASLRFQLCVPDALHALSLTAHEAEIMAREDELHQLLLGKGRPGVANLLHDVRRASAKSEDTAKGLLRDVLCASFSELGAAEGEPPAAAGPLVDWLYGVILKRAPWDSWTEDVYSAMRCIDHLPTCIL